jgi:hypothetical protein
MAIDLNIELGEVEVQDFMPILLDMSNVRAGINPRIGLDVDASILVRIKTGAAAPIQVQILTPAIDPPIAPLAVHMGQGIVWLNWSHPVPDKVQQYELFVATSQLGSYTKLERGVFLATHGVIQNMPLGRTLYFKLQAIGKNGATSSQVQVKLGKFYVPLVTMKMRSIEGSTIPVGAVFSTVDEKTGMLLTARLKGIGQNAVQVQF